MWWNAEMMRRATYSCSNAVYRQAEQLCLGAMPRKRGAAGDPCRWWVGRGNNGHGVRRERCGGRPGPFISYPTGAAFTVTMSQEEDAMLTRWAPVSFLMLTTSSPSLPLFLSLVVRALWRPCSSRERNVLWHSVGSKSSSCRVHMIPCAEEGGKCVNKQLKRT